MKDQPRKLVAQDGYWILVEKQGEGESAKVTTTGIPCTTPRKQAAELKARNG